MPKRGRPAPAGEHEKRTARAARRAGVRAQAPQNRRVVRRVEKRDGREVPFDVAKIRAAIAAAMDAVGEADPSFAAEVAGVVELTLHENARARRASEPEDRELVPHIEEIQDLVERALMELGRPAVAKAYILHRDRRARIRAALSVHPESLGPRTPIRVRENEGNGLWSKGRIVAALMEEAELPRATAEEVAASVERRVFASGLRRISTTLVRELVAGELFERGLSGALARHGVCGIARHDLRRLLDEQALVPWTAEVGGDALRFDTAEAVSREVLSRFALEDVLPDGVAELHRAGDLFVEDLGRPHLPLTLALDADLIAGGAPSAGRAFAALDALAETLEGVSCGLVLERPAGVLAPLVRSVRASSPLGLAGWLRSLAALARAANKRVDLGSSGTRFGAFTGRLVEELVELPPSPLAPRLFLEGHELEELSATRPDLAAVLERLLGEGRLVPTWTGGEEAFAGPGCHRRARERGVLACGGAIALNLPRLARRAGPWREEIVQTGLADLVHASLEAAHALEVFQRARARNARARGLRARVSFALVPVGLREALLVLGEGEVDPDQGARLLGLISEAASRFALDGACTVAPCPFLGEVAAARFAWLDRRRELAAGGTQPWLFEGASTARDAPHPYTTGFGLSPAPPWVGDAIGRAEAEALRTVPTGALSFAGLVDPVHADTDPSARPHLAAWRRFEVLRRAHAGELSLELFPSAPDVPVSSTDPVPDCADRGPEPLRPLA